MTKNAVELQLIGNVAKDWCVKQAEQSAAFHYEERFSSTFRKIRFSTETLEKAFPVSANEHGAWCNGHHAFYEIINTTSDLVLCCAAESKGLPRSKGTRLK